MLFTVTVPIQLVSTANARLHWHTLATTKKLQKLATRSALNGTPEPTGPVVVTFCRHGKRQMDDDNLAHAFKAVRDAVASWIGVDDGDTNFFAWKYTQKTGKDYKITITVERKG